MKTEPIRFLRWGFFPLAVLMAFAVGAAEHPMLVTFGDSTTAARGELKQSVDELLLDGIYPNDRGQRIVADGLLPLVKTAANKNAQAKVPMAR